MSGGIMLNKNVRMWYKKELMQLFGDLDVLLFAVIGQMNLVMVPEWIVREK